MECKIEKGKNLNPISRKEVVENYINNFDTSFKSRKRIKDGYEEVTKIKRNFK